MTIVRGSIPSFIQGVSQQPQNLRQRSQVDECINFNPSIVDSLIKRFPTDFIAKLNSLATVDRSHFFSPNGVDVFLLVIVAGVPRIFDLAGVEKTVTTPDGTSYLTGGEDDFRFMTSGEFTFVLNRTKTVAKSATLSTARPFEALVFVKQGNYSNDYNVIVNGVTRATKTTSASVATDIRTNTIAQDLTTQLTANLPAGFTADRGGANHVIYITHNTTDFTIKCEDSNSGRNLSAIKGSVALVSDLPKLARNGFVVEVLGDSESNKDNYYVEFKTHNGETMGEGVWLECAKPNTQHQLDKATMPHVIQRNVDGTFTFKRADWTPRDAGDDDTIPFPSFVGKKLNNVFIHKGRVGLVSSDSPVLSRSNNVFSFFKETALTVLDTDPIDVTALTNRTVNIQHAQTLDDVLILFSDTDQFLLYDDGTSLTTETVGISHTTSYACDADCQPVFAGNSVLFTKATGDITTVREAIRAGDTIKLQVVTTTQHVETYLPQIDRMVVDIERSAMYAVPKTKTDKLYLYKWYVQDGEYKQQAWSQWQFPNALVYNAYVAEDSLYLLVKRGSEFNIESINLNKSVFDEGLDFRIHLDSKRSFIGGTYDVLTGKTTFTGLPPYMEGVKLITVKDGDIVEHLGNLPSVGATAVILEGNYTGARLYWGIPYTAMFRFSDFYAQTPNSQGTVDVRTQGRLQVSSIILSYAKTGGFKIQIKPNNYPQTDVHFTGIVAGSFSAESGKLNMPSGNLRTFIRHRSDQVKIEVLSESWTPATFIKAEWEGRYASRKN
jgi:hypothetical protein